jgi:riboflavin biosynthesis pyrimidine reductase
LSNPTSADDCERVAHELYAASLPAAEGVLHIAAVWRAPDGRALVLAVNDAAPKSPTDAIVLGLARARADVIVTTGRILRHEPGLSHRLHDDPQVETALSSWREQQLGRRELPRTLILTRGEDVPLEHPIFAPDRDSRRLAPAIVTGERAAERLRAHAGSRAVDVIARGAPGLRDTIEFAREQFAARTLLVEAGPSSARSLYESPIAVDELLLTEYAGEALAERARGPEFIADATLEAAFGDAIAMRTAAVCVEEPSGRWSFGRYTRLGTQTKTRLETRAPQE